MPLMKLCCQYCGHTWEQLIYMYGQQEDFNSRCKECGDQNISGKEVSKEEKDIFGYNYVDPNSKRPLRLL